MALDFAKLAQTGIKAVTTAGVTAPITITRAPLPDPITGSTAGSSVVQTLRAVQADSRRYAKASDAAWTSVRTVLLVAAADCTFTPRRGDLVLYGGQHVRLSVVEEFAPNGTPIQFFLGLG